MTQASQRALATIVALLAAGLAHAREPEAYPTFPARLIDPAAVRVAARLAHELRDPRVAERLDLPPDVLVHAAAACLETASGTLAPEVRVQAASCAADLGADVAPLLADGAPAVRAAAAALLGASPRLGPTRRARLLPLAGDADPEVAATALGALCTDDAAATMNALDDPGRARLAALASSRSLDRGLAARLKSCSPSLPARR